MVKLSTQFLLKNLTWSISFLIAANISADCMFVENFGNNFEDNFGDNFEDNFGESFRDNFGDNSWEILGAILGTILETI